MSTFPPRCYYCDSQNFGSVEGYERHVVTRHPNLPGYPEPADIKFYGLEKQDMSWEGETKTDFDDAGALGCIGWAIERHLNDVSLY
jgi:hypothetical protein